MKKFILIGGLIIISTFIIFNLKKNAPTERLIKQQPTIINEISSTNEIGSEKVTQSSRFRYTDYTAASFNQVSDKKRVLFFHAKWCPTCKIANEEFIQNSDKIPADVILFKTDYDMENDLKSKYDITYQHTFVYVDIQGKEIIKWNGGGIAELISNITQ
ncbi:MAG: thioredoxin domain-containing protein [Patescibacteria group bacterium]